MGSFIDQLARVCREHLLPEKILISPSLAVGHQIGDRLARSGTPWVNLRVETVRSLVDALIGFEVAAEGITVLSRAQSLALVERACSEALGAGAYFSGLSGQRGLVEAFQQTLDDLRHASVALNSISGEAFEVPQKQGDLQRVLERYEALLTVEKYIDRAGMLLRAIEKLRRENVTWPERIWIDMREPLRRSQGGGCRSIRQDDRHRDRRTSRRATCWLPPPPTFARRGDASHAVH